MGLVSLAHLSRKELVDCRRTDMEATDDGSSQVDLNLARLSPTHFLNSSIPGLHQWTFTLLLGILGAQGRSGVRAGFLDLREKEERRTSWWEVKAVFDTFSFEGGGTKNPQLGRTPKPSLS